MAIVAAVLLALAAVLYLGFTSASGSDWGSPIPNSDAVTIVAFATACATLAAGSRARAVSAACAALGLAGVVVMFVIGQQPIVTPPDTSAITMLGPEFARGLLLVTAVFAGLVCIAALIANLTQAGSEPTAPGDAD